MEAALRTVLGVAIIALFSGLSAWIGYAYGDKHGAVESYKKCYNECGVNWQNDHEQCMSILDEDTRLLHACRDGWTKCELRGQR